MTEINDAPMAYRISTRKMSVSIGTITMPPPSPVSAPSRPAPKAPPATISAIVVVVIAGRNVATHASPALAARRSRQRPTFRLSDLRDGSAGISGGQDANLEDRTVERR